MRTAATALFTTVALSFLPTLGFAQDQPATTTKAATFVVEAGETKLTDLINRAAAYLQWNVLVNEQELAAPGQLPAFRLQQRMEVDRAGCEDLLAGMLYRSGFALTAIDVQKNLFEVVSMTGPRSREVMSRAVRRTPAEIMARPQLRIAVITTVELKHINAPIATNALRPFFASSSAGSASITIGNVGNNSGMLVLGMQDQVAAVLQILSACDVPPPPDAAPTSMELLEAIERRLQALEQKLGQPQAK